MKLLLTTIAAVLLVGCNNDVEVDISKIIEERHANIDSTSSIQNAAKKGDIEAVKKHLASGIDVNDDGGIGMSALQNAAAFGHSDIVQLLINNGANVNPRNPFNLTPLDQASMLNFTETIEIIREHGGKTGEELEPSEANTEASLGESPMEVQAEATGFDVSDISIFLAADAGNIGAVKKHLASGEDVNSQDPELATPLHYAASGGHKEVADFLIEKGATVNALGVHGTPLDNAIRQNHTEVTELLRKHGGKTGEELKAARK